MRNDSVISFYCKHDDWTSIKYTVDRDLSVPEIMQEFKRFLLAVGYQPEDIEEYIENE